MQRCKLYFLVLTYNVIYYKYSFMYFDRFGKEFLIEYFSVSEETNLQILEDKLLSYIYFFPLLYDVQSLNSEKYYKTLSNKKLQDIFSGKADTNYFLSLAENYEMSGDANYRVYLSEFLNYIIDKIDIDYVYNSFLKKSKVNPKLKLQNYFKITLINAYKDLLQSKKSELKYNQKHLVYSSEQNDYIVKKKLVAQFDSLDSNDNFYKDKNMQIENDYITELNKNEIKESLEYITNKIETREKLIWFLKTLTAEEFENLSDYGKLIQEISQTGGLQITEIMIIIKSANKFTTECISKLLNISACSTDTIWNRIKQKIKPKKSVIFK
jgi:hypothetical protein